MNKLHLRSTDIHYPTLQDQQPRHFCQRQIGLLMILLSVFSAGCGLLLEDPQSYPDMEMAGESTTEMAGRSSTSDQPNNSSTSTRLDEE